MLSDPDGSNAIAAALVWIEQVLLGDVATIIAIIAVAGVGFRMMTGRVDVRRGLTVIVGCFVLFAAPEIASGLLASTTSGAPPAPPPMATISPPPVFAPAPAPAQTPRPYDPYAGAAVPG